MKYLDLFSGVGGFTLGIQQANDNRPNIRNRIEDIREDMSDTEKPSDGITCIGFSEIDKYAAKVYQHHFPTHHNYGDITKINAEELPDFDLLVGGFPCQSFSIAGKRRGFEDTRGTLFFDIARILQTKRPRLFLLENVKGLLSHDNGNTFKTIISTLDELGYDLQWQVLNSKNHGVPQNRERIFIIGHLRGTSRPEVFPFRGADKEVNNTSWIQSDANRRLISRTLLARDFKDPKIVQLNSPTHSNDRVYGEDGISPTLNTMQGGMRQPFIQAIDTKNQGAPRFTENVATLGANDYKEPKGVTDGMKIRRLTPTECERLQGFPDQWTAVENTSDSQRYKMCGNAVTVNVIRDIMEKLLK